MAVRTLETMRLEVLHQLFSTATQEASTAMSRWTRGLITLSLDEVREIPLCDVSTELDFGQELWTMVVLTLQGELGGDMILAFDDDNGRHLAAALMNRPVNTDPEWSALEKSCLNETGNILGCAYLNTLTRLIDAELVPSPPMFIQDYGASVLQQALMTQAALCDQVLICRTNFQREGESLNWNVFFVPTPQLRSALESAMLSS